ncbi:MAG: hypothetical protein E7655_00450 [Ruminococcaceae bacterium]|nr:hypothetical protein [Oscillospiraceae bacterium]
MKRKTKFYLGLAMMGQALFFLILFFVLWKKRSFATALLLLSSAGGVAGMFVVYRQLTAQAEEPVFEAFEELCLDDPDDGVVRF